jgi:hypothetical protein
MKLKLLIIVLLVSGMAGNVFATKYADMTGNWAAPGIWSDGIVPIDDGNEVKIGSADNLTVTVNTNVGNYTTTKIDMARGCTLSVTGGYIGNGRELHVGDAGMSGSGTDVGYLTQTGGTVDITGKLQIGYKAGGNGTYTISGGSLTGSGKMYVACSSADGSIGKFKVVGNATSISLGGNLYVANDSASSSGNTGTATIEFELAADGNVSPIQVAATIIDSQNEAAAVANLVVTATGAAPAGDLLLIENTGTDAVVGKFDTINGVAAAEGALVTIGSTDYRLTYLYASQNTEIHNDIALLIPEPAAIALLSLGMFIIRRKK